MSIFKETFKDFVFRQLKIREAIVEKGNDHSTRFGNPRDEIEVKGKTEKIKIPAGAFYTNSVVKQCTIKMASGVDITSDILGGQNPADIAKQYVLQAGVLDQQNLREGFGTDIKKRTAYGDPLIKSDASDGFGIVPMPGIIEANIRTKTAYGSLREANVNFVCHNRKQLEILELLYMRPGMPILLEWQWTPAIVVDRDESGSTARIENNTSAFSIISDWFNESEKISELNKKILNQKKLSSGNYDGFVGFCKNFEIVSRNDGGFDCTTELIAAGEVLESIKTRRDGFLVNEDGEDREIDNIQLIFEGILELSPLRTDLNKYQTLIGQKRNRTDPNSKFIVPPLIAAQELLKIILDLQLDRESFYEELENVVGQVRATRSRQQRGVREKYNKKIDSFYESQKDFFIWKNELIGKENLFADIVTLDLTAEDDYVRWDFLCDLINKLAFPLIDPSDPENTLLSLDYRQPTNGSYAPEDLRYLEFSDFSLIETHLKEFKVGEAVFNEDLVDSSKSKIGDKIFVDDILNNSFNPKICLLPKQNFKNSNPRNFIGHIMLNVKHLKNVYNQMAYNSNDELVEDFSLFNYFKKIWDDVNKACAGHYNFVLNVENERPDVCRIIDLQINEVDSSLRDELFEFKIQSNKSVIRDFNFNTTIPSGLSATIAVASQAPTSIDDLNSVTFANWTRGIKSRFTKIGELPKNTTKSKSLTPAEVYDKDLKRYYTNVLRLKSYLFVIQKGKYDGDGNEIDGKAITSVISLVKSVEKLIISLSYRYGEGTGELKGLRKEIVPLRTPEIIPIKFNAIMDGISGFTIGNVFKVEKEKLPIGYQHDDVAFVVLGESQNITSGQDWTTEISGQLILLDKNKDELEKVNKKYQENLLIYEDIPSIQDRTTTYINPVIPVISEDDNVDQEFIEEFFRPTDGDTTLN